MAKEYLASKTPGGRRIHILDTDASFSEYCYDREEVVKEVSTEKIVEEKDWTDWNSYILS